MSQKPILLFKSHVDTYTRTDGVVVQAHETKVHAASKFAVQPFRHGGHQVTANGKHHVILQDKGVAEKHAAALNHVEGSGKAGHMASSVSAAAEKHLDISDAGSAKKGDDDDFHDTGKAGVKAALESAYHAGAGGDHPHLREHRDAVVKEAAKHFAGFDSLKVDNSDRSDFKENSTASIRDALQHAYAHGSAAAAGGAKPAAKPAESAGSGIGTRRQNTLKEAAAHMVQLWGNRPDRIKLELRSTKTTKNSAEDDFIMNHVHSLLGAGSGSASGKKSLADVAKAHDKHFEHKALDWHTRAHEVPASEIPAGAPEFSHKDVYGHNGVTSPSGDDFSDEFKAKSPEHFVIKHPNGKRHLVHTEGAGYARRIVPISKS